MTRYVFMVSLLLTSASLVFAQELTISPAQFGKPQEIAMNMGKSFKTVSVNIQSVKLTAKANNKADARIVYEILNDRTETHLPRGKIKFVIMTKTGPLCALINNVTSLGLGASRKKVVQSTVIDAKDKELVVTGVKVTLTDDKKRK